MILQLIDEAVQNGARIKSACAILGVSTRTVERYRKLGDGSDDLRMGPKTEPPNKLTPKERQKLLEVVNQPEFRDLPPSQIVPKLADRNEYICSEATMYRVLKEEAQLQHRGKTKEPQERRAIERYATQPNQIWSWDITYLRGPVKGTFFYLYMIMDIWSRKIVGFEVHDMESSELASKLVRKAALAEGVSLKQLTLHSDNGSPMKGATLLATLERLGIAASFTRPKVCDDNPFSESLFKTLKYRPEYPSDPFASLEAAQDWVQAFVDWYHEEHLHSGIKFVRPIDRHEGRDEAILEHRKEVYEAAKKRHPNRWGSRDTRDWTPPKRVCVRACKKKNDEKEEKKAA